LILQNHVFKWALVLIAFACTSVAAKADSSGVISLNQIQVGYTLEYLPPACDPNTSYNCDGSSTAAGGRYCDFEVTFPISGPMGRFTDYNMSPDPKLPDQALPNLPSNSWATSDQDCLNTIAAWKATLPQGGVHYELETVDDGDERYEVLILDGIGQVEQQFSQ
jgi:hypothetical protein